MIQCVKVASFLLALLVSACASGGPQTSSDANALDVDTGP